MYDVTCKASFEEAKLWVEEVCNLRLCEPESLAFVVAANKTDLQEEREVSNNEGKLFSKSIGAAYFESSAKTGAKVKELFLETSRRILSGNYKPGKKEELVEWNREVHKQFSRFFRRRIELFLMILKRIQLQTELSVPKPIVDKIIKKSFGN